MFPLLFPLLGAAGGALMNRKDPLKGALLGGALGFGGAALAPAAGAGAAGAAGAGSAGAGSAAGGSLLGGSTASLGSTGATLGTGSAQLGTSGLLGTGTAASGTNAAAMGNIMGQGTMSTAGSAVGAQPGLLDQGLAMYGKIEKPLNTAMQAYDTGKGQPQQSIQPQPLQNRPLDMSQYMSGPQDMDNERRKQMMQQYAQYAQRGY